MNYVMSDIHGNYEAYLKMLEEIHFSEEDMLYVLGDVLDRGPHPIKVVLDLMKRPNVELIAGNHEAMALSCLQFLMQEITEESIGNLDEEMVERLLSWQGNGAVTTTDEFHKLSRSEQEAVKEYLEDAEMYEEVYAGGKVFILVHAGLGNFTPEKEIWEYELDELVWLRPDYSTPYFQDKYVVTGHTPTMMIEDNPHPGYIYQANNHIAIDCGCIIPGGRLGCIRLEDMKEFYVNSF